MKKYSTDILMPSVKFKTILTWLQKNPGIFRFQEEGRQLYLLEVYSQKQVVLDPRNLEAVQEKKNQVLAGQTYLILLFSNGQQLVLSPQGFAFAPDFKNTGPLPLPNPVYCLKDYHNLMSSLEQLSIQPDRRKESLELVMILIAILDGAKAVGLGVEDEIQKVEAILSCLENNGKFHN